LATPSRRLPPATLICFLLTAAVGAAQLARPAVLETFRRDPAAFAAGEWWRLGTALFVQADGWPQPVSNLAMLAFVGPAVERRRGSAGWLLLYLAGGLAGQLAGVWREPRGAGNSVAILGLVGGLFVPQARAGRITSPIATLGAAVWIALIVGLATDSPIVTAALVLTAGAAYRPAPAADIWRAGALWLVAVGGGLALVLLRDNHGPALLAGTVLAVAARGPAADRAARAT